MAGHRPVPPAGGDPSRTARVHADVELVSFNKQSVWVERAGMEKAAALAIIPHHSAIPQSPTQELQDATITHFSLFFLFLFLISRP